MENKKNNLFRLLELDALRGLAAISVLCYHYTTRYTELFDPHRPTAFHFLCGQYGVILFFIISGFVIFMTLERTKKPLDFVISRFSRLYPAYWTSIIITYIALNTFHLALPIKLQSTGKDAIVNLTMLQEWFGARHVAGSYWTLTIELSFYFIIFSIFLLKKLKYIEFLGLGWLAIMVLEHLFLWRVHFYIPSIFKISKLLIFGHLFLAGIVFYKLKTQGNAWYRHVILGACLMVQYIMREEISPDPYSTLCTALFFFIFYLFVYDRLRWIVQKPLIYLGTISYSLYLIHEFIGFIMINRLYSIGVDPWLCFLMPTAGSLLIATVMTYSIERPAMDYIRSVYKNRSK